MKKDIIRLLVGVVFLVAGTACGDDSDSSESPCEVVFREDVINCLTTDNPIRMQGDQSLYYTATVTEGTAWCSFSKSQTDLHIKKGKLEPVIFLYTSVNNSSEDRTARVKVELSNGQNFELKLTQLKYSGSAAYDRAWAEQPLHKQNANYWYHTHYVTLNSGKTIRNFSFCYDKSKRASCWVAYPLHAFHRSPNYGRSDLWAYDPDLKQSEQADIVRTYAQSNTYARGHQIPSADRVSVVEMNEQTFYATNMTPQLHGLNSNFWATVEDRVRKNIVSDTLFVVTGAHFGDGRTTNDRSGNKVGVPTHYYKVLLRTRSGKTGKRIADCTADELQAIGLWIPHKANSSNTIKASDCLSVQEIEARTGFTFFRNLRPEAAEAVKAQNKPSDWYGFN